VGANKNDHGYQEDHPHVGRAADARGVAVTTHQRDISWDCNSEEAALSLSKKLQQVPTVTVEIIEIED